MIFNHLDVDSLKDILIEDFFEFDLFFGFFFDGSTINIRL